jgi:hypothetical protein
MMAHDKISAAARQRMAETGEPYAAARRAVVAEHQAAEGQIPSGGCALRMSGEIRGWLNDLRDSDPAAAKAVGQAVAALMAEGARLGAPLAVSTADSWPWALAEALDRSYQESLDRLTALRRGLADAASLVKEIQDQPAELADEARQLLPGAIRARDRLAEALQRLQPRAEAFRVRKDVLKARYTAAHTSILASQVIAASGPAGESGRQQQPAGGEALSAAEARLLRDGIAQMEQELGQQPWPEGLMELRPGTPGGTGIRILFAIEPPGTALLIAVLDGPEAIQDQRLEAILLSADMLSRVRAGQAPEAAAHGYPGIRSFLAEFYPRDASAGGPVSARPHKHV